MSLFPQRLPRLAGFSYEGYHRYFVTTCTALRRPLFTERWLATAVTEQLRDNAGRFDFALAAYCVMPDHVHGILAFPGDAALSVTVGAWKKYLACAQGIRWQANFFDHRIRSPVESRETWDYIRRNPVVAKLCAHEDEWPWQFTP